jgi:hypothetical protein
LPKGPQVGEEPVFVVTESLFVVLALADSSEEEEFWEGGRELGKG